MGSNCSGGQEVPEGEVIGDDPYKVNGGPPAPPGLQAVDCLVPETTWQLQADPVHQRVNVLGKVQEVPIQKLRDSHPTAGRRDADGRLQVVPLGHLKLVLHLGGRVNSYLKWKNNPSSKNKKKVKAKFSDCLLRARGDQIFPKSGNISKGFIE